MARTPVRGVGVALLSAREVLGPEHFGSLWPFHRERKMTFYDCICITWQYSHFRLKYSFNLKLGLFFLTKLSKTFVTHPSEFWDSETVPDEHFPCLCSERVVGNADGILRPSPPLRYLLSCQPAQPPAPPNTSLDISTSFFPILAITQCGLGHSWQVECRSEKSVGRNFIFGSYIYSSWPTSQGKEPFFPFLSSPSSSVHPLSQHVGIRALYHSLSNKQTLSENACSWLLFSMAQTSPQKASHGLGRCGL